MRNRWRRSSETSCMANGALTFLGTLVAGAKLAMNRTEEVLNLLDEIEQLSIETHQQMFIPICIGCARKRCADWIAGTKESSNSTGWRCVSRGSEALRLWSCAQPQDWRAGLQRQLVARKPTTCSDRFMTSSPKA